MAPQEAARRQRDWPQEDAKIGGCWPQKGAEGAKSAIQSVIGSVADAILPGVGGVVSEIVGVLSQGPDKVKELANNYGNSLKRLEGGKKKYFLGLINKIKKDLVKKGLRVKLLNPLDSADIKIPFFKKKEAK